MLPNLDAVAGQSMASIDYAMILTRGLLLGESLVYVGTVRAQLYCFGKRGGSNVQQKFNALEVGVRKF